MKDVFRKIASLFGLNQEHDVDSGDKPEQEEAPFEIQPEIQVRTKSVYPHRQPDSVPFRFPVIPDSVEKGKKEKREERRPAPLSPSPIQQRSRPPQQSKEKENLKPKIDTPHPEKKPFKQTEFISPVYGTKARAASVENRSNSSASHYSVHISGTVNKEAQPPSSLTQSSRLTPPAYRETASAVDTIDELKEAEKTHHGGQVERERGERVQVQSTAAAGIIEGTKEDTQTEELHLQRESFLESSPAEDYVQDSSAPADGDYQPAPVVRPVHRLTLFRYEEEERSDRFIATPPSDDVALSADEPESESIVTPLEHVSVPAENRITLELDGNEEGVAVRQKPEERTQEVFRQEEVRKVTAEEKPYLLPHMELLKREPHIQTDDEMYIREQMKKLADTLENFNVKAEVIGAVKGPSVTRYELQPAPGVKVNKFTNLIDDIKLSLAAKDIRMEAPIPGRSAIGIEVPNEVSTPVFIRSIVESEEFREHPSPLAVALGRDISGTPVVGDLKKMPHGLIAGSTGSGKSVCINSIIISLLYKTSPAEVRLILIDPKVVELAPYNHIPHLLTPVVTDPKQATAALKWACSEMDSRYEKFADSGARDIDRFNKLAAEQGKEKMPYIVIIIDELADLMMVAPGDVEESICRIAQKARACGIHLLVATQRPSVDVITGLIKANIPSRVAFAVSSQADSRTILDMGGAERLLGRGDMLYYPSGIPKPVRLQGNFVSDEEIEQVVDHVKRQEKPNYLFDKEELSRVSVSGAESDELFEEALEFTVEQGQASASSLQRRFRIGYNRAARLVDMMEAEGFISGQSGSKPRDVLITMDDFRNMFG